MDISIKELRIISTSFILPIIESRRFLISWVLFGSSITTCPMIVSTFIIALILFLIFSLSLDNSNDNSQLLIIFFILLILLPIYVTFSSSTSSTLLYTLVLYSFSISSQILYNSSSTLTISSTICPP